MKSASTQRTQFTMMFFAFTFGMVLSNLLGQGQRAESDVPAAGPGGADEVLVTYRGIDKTLNDLPADIAEAYRTLQQQTAAQEIALLQQAALQWGLAEHAHAQQLPLDEAAQSYLKWEKPDAAAVNALYAQEAEKLDKPFYAVREELRRYLDLQRARQAKQQVVAAMMARGDLILFPDRPHNDGQ